MSANSLRKTAFFAVLSTLPACTGLVHQNDVMPTRADGAVFFANNCASCHGAGGQPSAPTVAKLATPPQDLTALSRDNGGVFPRARALSYIYGDPENSHLSRVMPQFGQVMTNDLVPVEIDGVLTPTPRALAGLLEYLESIQQ